MIYPAYIHLGDEKTAHGVALPDFPGCFSSADEYDDIPSQVQDAVELYFEGEDLEVPRRRILSRVKRWRVRWRSLDVDRYRYIEIRQ